MEIEKKKCKKLVIVAKLLKWPKNFIAQDFFGVFNVKFQLKNVWLLQDYFYLFNDIIVAAGEAQGVWPTTWVLLGACATSTEANLRQVTG